MSDYQIIHGIHGDDAFLAGYLLGTLKAIEQGRTIGMTPPEFVRFHFGMLVEEGRLRESAPVDE